MLQLPIMNNMKLETEYNWAKDLILSHLLTWLRSDWRIGSDLLWIYAVQTSKSGVNQVKIRLLFCPLCTDSNKADRTREESRSSRTNVHTLCVNIYTLYIHFTQTYIHLQVAQERREPNCTYQSLECECVKEITSNLVDKNFGNLKWKTDPHLFLYF